jgi:hypothetical protein
MGQRTSWSRIDAYRGRGNGGPEPGISPPSHPRRGVGFDRRAGPLARSVGLVEELGAPIAYLIVKEGTPVYDRDRDRIGVVEHVLADETLDIFRGLIVHTVPLPGRHLFADAEQIAELREKGVLLSVDREELHEPSDRPAARNADGGSVESPLQAALRHAWDWLSRHR